MVLVLVVGGWCSDGLGLITAAFGVLFALLWIVCEALGWTGPWWLLPGGECLVRRSIEGEEVAAAAAAWIFTAGVVDERHRETRGAGESAY